MSYPAFIKPWEIGNKSYKLAGFLHQRRKEVPDCDGWLGAGSCTPATVSDCRHAAKKSLHQLNRAFKNSQKLAESWKHKRCYWKTFPYQPSMCSKGNFQQEISWKAFLYMFQCQQQSSWKCPSKPGCEWHCQDRCPAWINHECGPKKMLQQHVAELLLKDPASSTHLESHIHVLASGRSWALLQSESSHTAGWCLGAVGDKGRLNWNARSPGTGFERGLLWMGPHLTTQDEISAGVWEVLNLDFTQRWNSAQVYGVRVLLQLPPKEQIPAAWIFNFKIQLAVFALFAAEIQNKAQS